MEEKIKTLKELKNWLNNSIKKGEKFYNETEDTQAKGMIII